MAFDALETILFKEVSGATSVDTLLLSVDGILGRYLARGTSRIGAGTCATHFVALGLIHSF